MIIESHQHFWNYDPIKDAWIDDSMEEIRRDFLPKDLKPLLDKNAIDGCIAVQADQSENETDFLLSCAQKNKFIKGVIGWLDLTSDNLDSRLNHYVKNPLFKGLRHIVQAEKDDYLIRDDVQKGISKLANYNLTYDILIFPSQLNAAIELVKKFPKQQFVLDHIAKPHISNSMDELWRSNIIELSKNQNVSCKLSGLVTETNNCSFNDIDFYPYLDIIFQSFGPKRILFGSDWPVCLLAANYKKVYDLIFDYLDNHSTKIKAQIFGLNAIKIYNL